MIFTNFFPEAATPPVDRMVRMLSAAFPHASCSLKKETYAQIATLHCWFGKHRTGGYAFASELFTEESRVAELHHAIEGYIAKIRRLIEERPGEPGPS